MPKMKIMSLFTEDSGTRNPDRRPGDGLSRDGFALGGILINEEDESVARTALAKFCETGGLPILCILATSRMNTGRLSWLAMSEAEEYKKFMRGVAEMLLGLPVLGHACVIDRPLRRSL
jgi:hypothetical protein